MQELLTEEEQDELNKLFVEFQDEDGDDETDDSETDSDSDENDEEIDSKGNLKDFVINDDEETESEAEEDNGEVEEDVAGPSTKIPKGKNKAKLPKKSKGKKSKGKKREKGEKKGKKTMTLADLKKLSTRNANARKAYIRRLRADWMTSAKIEKTLEIVKRIINDPAEEKVLIFSQWTSLLDLLEVPISREKWNYRRYDGSMSPSLRGDAVDDFRDPRKNVRIMLVSLKAGNAGLNLNAANNVIVLDPFWNPYIEGKISLVSRGPFPYITLGVMLIHAFRTSHRPRTSPGTNEASQSTKDPCAKHGGRQNHRIAGEEAGSNQRGARREGRTEHRPPRRAGACLPLRSDS